MYPYNINKYQIKNTLPQSNEISMQSSYIQLETPLENSQIQPEMTTQPDKRLLEMITNAIADETSTASYYKKLMPLITDSSDKEIIRGIYADENKHRRLLDDMYFLLTGGYSPTPAVETTAVSNDFSENFSKGVIDELNDGKFYRELYFSFQNPEIRDVFFEIMTDEQDHAAKFNYLYSKYKK